MLCCSSSDRNVTLCELLTFARKLFKFEFKIIVSLSLIPQDNEKGASGLNFDYG